MPAKYPCPRCHRAGYHLKWCPHYYDKARLSVGRHQHLYDLLRKHTTAHLAKAVVLEAQRGNKLARQWIGIVFNRRKERA